MTVLELWKWINKGSWLQDDKTDTEYKYTIIDDVLYISFQGSLSFKDWLYNLMIWKKPYKGMKTVWFAHAGFVKKWKAIQTDIFTIIDRVVDFGEINKIIISGHSQGAGIATLATEAIWFNYPDLRERIETVLFGSPRAVGFWNFLIIKERFKNVIRYEQFWDIIPRIPFVLLGYKHIGKRIRIGNPWYKPTLRFTYNHIHYGDYL